MSGAAEEEIERKFLVKVAEVKQLLAKDIERKNYIDMSQGYFVRGPVSLRVRLASQHASERVGELTLKGPGAVRRYEKNVDIPPDMANALLESCPGAIRKNRFRMDRWEIDRFLNVLDPDSNTLLWVAEIELKSEDETFDKPSWLGREVTHDSRYTNARLSEHILRG